MNLKDFQKKYTPQIDKFLEDHLASEVNNPIFSKIMSYSVMAGGRDYDRSFSWQHLRH